MNTATHRIGKGPQAVAAAASLTLALSAGVLAAPAASASQISHLAGYSDGFACGASCVLQDSFVVPGVACPSPNTQHVLLGARFDTIPGMHQMQGGVVASCSGGLPALGTLYQFNGGAPGSGKVPAPGDSMTVILSFSATPSITITDSTAMWTQTKSGPSPVPTEARAGARALGCLASGACWPVPQFSSPVPFTGVKLGGVLATAPPWVSSNIDPTTAPPSEATATALGGGAFTVNWVSTCAIVPKC